MTNGNPFYVHPGTDFGSGLMGLAQTVERVGERKEAEEKDRIMREEISAAIESKDSDKIRSVAGKYPELGTKIKDIMEMKLPGGSAGAYKNALFSASVDFTQGPQILENLRTQFAQDGIDPQEQAKLDDFESLLESDPETAQKNVEAEFAMLADKDMWDRYKDIIEQPDSYEGLSSGYETFLRANNLESSPESYTKYKESEATGYDKNKPIPYSLKNPDGSVRTIPNVVPGSEQANQLEALGFKQGKETIGAKKTAMERRAEKLEKSMDKLQTLAAQDPNKFYEDHNFRMNDDGTLYLDPVDLIPVRLKPFTNTLGKRGNMKAIKVLGEQMDDARELMELLELPSVRKDLHESSTEIVDQTIGKTKNTLNAFLRRRGIAVDSNTATAMARIQRMASEERKRFMGTAVTTSEIQTALEWMPSSSDTFETMINKTRLVGQEAEQEFRRWLVMHENDSDMSPFYKAFGMKRFNNQGQASPIVSDPLGIR